MFEDIHNTGENAGDRRIDDWRGIPPVIRNLADQASSLIHYRLQVTKLQLLLRKSDDLYLENMATLQCLSSERGDAVEEARAHIGHIE